jgi:hypothetical protein
MDLSGTTRAPSMQGRRRGRLRRGFRCLEEEVEKAHAGQLSFAARIFTFSGDLARPEIAWPLRAAA